MLGTCEDLFKEINELSMKTDQAEALWFPIPGYEIKE